MRGEGGAVGCSERSIDGSGVGRDSGATCGRSAHAVMMGEGRTAVTDQGERMCGRQARLCDSLSDVRTSEHEIAGAEEKR